MSVQNNLAPPSYRRMVPHVVISEILLNSNRRCCFNIAKMDQTLENLGQLNSDQLAIHYRILPESIRENDHVKAVKASLWKCTFQPTQSLLNGFPSGMTALVMQDIPDTANGSIQLPFILLGTVTVIGFIRCLYYSLYLERK